MQPPLQRRPLFFTKLSFVILAITAVPAPAAAAKTGFHKEVRVGEPTRIDWEFAVSPFGPDAAKLPKDYDSRKQRYLLYVPKNYKPGKSWPLVVFISPDEDPLGWRFWEKTCRSLGMLFCAPYGAGNSCPVGKRTRIVLDMLDDVRRHWRIDADQTYITGFSGGGRMACTIGFSLPEYFGGVIPICGTNPLHPQLIYLQHRVRDRLSVAFVTGAEDINRKENEVYMFPWFQAIKVRSKLWVVPNMGHGIPPAEVIDEVHAWLARDLKRRRADAKVLPGLAALPGKVPTAEEQAGRQLETAQSVLKKADHTWQGVSLLEGIKVRWAKTKAAAKAKELLEELLSNPDKAKLIEEQGGPEQQRSLTAQAKGWERLGNQRQAYQFWKLLARTQPDSPGGKKAALEVKRLQAILAKEPFLGLGFKDGTTTIKFVLPKGPAGKAGLQANDVVIKMGTKEIATLPDLAQALKAHKPGDKVKVQVRRDGKLKTITVEIGSRPEESDK
jgi:hypothetical protein